MRITSWQRLLLVIVLLVAASKSETVLAYININDVFGGTPVQPPSSVNYSSIPMPFGGTSSTSSSSSRLSSRLSSSSLSSVPIIVTTTTTGGNGHTRNTQYVAASSAPTLEPFPVDLHAAASAPVLPQNTQTVGSVTVSPAPTLHSGAPRMASSGPGMQLTILLVIIAASVIMLRVPGNKNGA